MNVLYVTVVPLNFKEAFVSKANLKFSSKGFIYSLTKYLDAILYEGVMVYIHNGDGYSVCTAPQETDENGIAKFTLKTSNDYSVQIDGVPNGYNVREGLTKEDYWTLPFMVTFVFFLLTHSIRHSLGKRWV